MRSFERGWWRIGMRVRRGRCRGARKKTKFSEERSPTSSPSSPSNCLHVPLLKKLHNTQRNDSHQGIWQVDRRRHEAGAGPHPPREEERREARVFGLKSFFSVFFKKGGARKRRRRKKLSKPEHREKTGHHPSAQASQQQTQRTEPQLFFRFSPDFPSS